MASEPSWIPLDNGRQKLCSTHEENGSSVHYESDRCMDAEWLQLCSGSGGEALRFSCWARSPRDMGALNTSWPELWSVTLPTFPGSYIPHLVWDCTYLQLDLSFTKPNHLGIFAGPWTREHRDLGNDPKMSPSPPASSGIQLSLDWLVDQSTDRASCLWSLLATRFGHGCWKELDTTWYRRLWLPPGVKGPTRSIQILAGAQWFSWKRSAAPLLRPLEVIRSCRKNRPNRWSSSCPERNRSRPVSSAIQLGLAAVTDPTSQQWPQAAALVCLWLLHQPDQTSWIQVNS